MLRRLVQLVLPRSYRKLTMSQPSHRTNLTTSRRTRPTRSRGDFQCACARCRRVPQKILPAVRISHRSWRTTPGLQFVHDSIIQLSCRTNLLRVQTLQIVIYQVSFFRAELLYLADIDIGNECSRYATKHATCRTSRGCIHIDILRPKLAKKNNSR